MKTARRTIRHLVNDPAFIPVVILSTLVVGGLVGFILSKI